MFGTAAQEELAELINSFLEITERPITVADLQKPSPEVVIMVMEKSLTELSVDIESLKVFNTNSSNDIQYLLNLLGSCKMAFPDIFAHNFGIFDFLRPEHRKIQYLFGEVMKSLHNSETICQRLNDEAEPHCNELKRLQDLRKHSDALKADKNYKALHKNDCDKRKIMVLKELSERKEELEEQKNERKNYEMSKEKALRQVEETQREAEDVLSNLQKLERDLKDLRWLTSDCSEIRAEVKDLAKRTSQEEMEKNKMFSLIGEKKDKAEVTRKLKDEAEKKKNLITEFIADMKLKEEEERKREDSNKKLGDLNSMKREIAQKISLIEQEQKRIEVYLKNENPQKRKEGVENEILERKRSLEDLEKKLKKGQKQLKEMTKEVEEVVQKFDQLFAIHETINFEYAQSISQVPDLSEEYFK